jgi:hypothetical protein
VELAGRNAKWKRNQPAFLGFHPRGDTDGHPRRTETAEQAAALPQLHEFPGGASRDPPQHRAKTKTRAEKSEAMNAPVTPTIVARIQALLRLSASPKP